MKTEVRSQKSEIRIAAALAVLALTLLSRSTWAQGSITPPASPGPTFKTLQQVQPRTPINTNTTPGDADSLFKITQPGSYYLTANITGVAGKGGIEIASSGVTLDLMGFELAGVAGTANGVTVSIAATNIAIRNGTVRNWVGAGVQAVNAFNSQFQNLRLSHNSDGAGIIAGDGNTIVRCTATGNSGPGIAASDGCTVSECTATGNDSSGISVSDGSRVSTCTAIGNGGHGIFASDSEIYRCTANFNSFDGIYVSVGCTARDNTCSGNGQSIFGGAGISASGGDNRIDGNNVTQNDRGIQCSATGNIVLRNTASGNTGPPMSGGATADYDFSDTTTTYGPIVTKTSGALTTAGFEAHPWANFRY